MAKKYVDKNPRNSSSPRMLLLFAMHLARSKCYSTQAGSLPFSPKRTGEKEWCYTYKYTHFLMPHLINKIFTTTIHAHKSESFGTLNNTPSLLTGQPHSLTLNQDTSRSKTFTWNQTSWLAMCWHFKLNARISLLSFSKLCWSKTWTSATLLKIQTQPQSQQNLSSINPVCRWDPAHNSCRFL